ncbi:MAG: phosphoribosylaminoimidazolesuccinocarboxamide synthase [Syntrophales bacterium]|jgi:phosphoribosylaminoimidazole-succinocarboxamide synthase|nr:phosphoribosylaminoimidazolesuccinocarboxamide synthase [Syntrophales bacterium]HOG08568.1 phosphoribosylaminoimidazolesuccinocarboxamide synthase [Syntrophales bacterium]HOS76937.1 phosphoribosylaminoimidazolesuccinocarboxamide synthase [Syntrophales bacterium]HPB70529.1 phosphoribosylaminoimidazolesuccinocarboxamide synthase [Syntrophales bacterium]HQN26230.1 phosphoribosylaminoimidazolesuccinocarboxamide synthase [Syntrophales bacterium]
MNEPTGLNKTDLAGLKLISRGKVRDIYDLDPCLLIVATDRISAFDVIMDEPIPGKGEILTRMSAFWFGAMADLIGNHLISTDPDAYPESCRPYRDILKGRSMLVRKARPLPVECIVRGYLSGSGWKDYRRDRTVSGITLPAGLKESARLPKPLFTPSTKAPEGEHDATITRGDMEALIGRDLAEQVLRTSLAVYRRAGEIAERAGIIIADTKMEFGICDGDLILIDELLTPDSSRFWPRSDYAEGRVQKSFDKQFLRDYLLSIPWNQTAPPPPLPRDIIEKTKEKYEEALRRLVPDR